jgi:hypothetical protein
MLINIMTNSFKKTIWNLRGNMTDYRKQAPLLIGGRWMDLSNKEEETERIFKRTTYENRDGKKKHGKFLMVKDGKSMSWTCQKHNITRFPDCDWAEKYVPPCKTNSKYKLVKHNIGELN